MNNKRILQFFSFSAGLALVGCQALTPTQVPKQAQQQLQKASVDTNAASAQTNKHLVPNAVMQDLLTSNKVTAAPQLPRFDIAASDVALNDFFQSLVADTPYSVVLHPNVTGTINLQLKKVSLPEVMTIVQQLYGFDIRQQGLVYKIHPAGLRTETIAVNYLMLQRKGFSSIAVNSGGVSQDNQNNNQNQNNRNSTTQINFNQDGFNNQSQSQAQNTQQQFNGSTIQSESLTDFWQGLEKAVKPCCVRKYYNKRLSIGS